MVVARSAAGRLARPSATSSLEARLVDRQVARAQARHPRGIHVQADHVMAEVRQAGGGHEADVAGADDGDVHRASVPDSPPAPKVPVRGSTTVCVEGTPACATVPPDAPPPVGVRARRRGREPVRREPRRRACRRRPGARGATSRARQPAPGRSSRVHAVDERVRAAADHPRPAQRARPGAPRRSWARSQEVDFRDYVAITMAVEWPEHYPLETLKAGAIATKQFAWYYVIHPRGRRRSSCRTASKACYDVVDTHRGPVLLPREVRHRQAGWARAQDRARPWTRRGT